MQDSENATAAKVFQQKISTALTALDDEDNRAAAALGEAFREIGSLLGNQPDRLDRTVVDILDGKSDTPGTPTELHRLWESLTPNEKRRVGEVGSVPSVAGTAFPLSTGTTTTGGTSLRSSSCRIERSLPDTRPCAANFDRTRSFSRSRMGTPSWQSVIPMPPATSQHWFPDRLRAVGRRRRPATNQGHVRRVRKGSTDGSHISDPVGRIRRSPRHSRRSIGSGTPPPQREARQLPGRVTNLA